jgi:hypothetical protein
MTASFHIVEKTELAFGEWTFVDVGMQVSSPFSNTGAVLDCRNGHNVRLF